MTQMLKNALALANCGLRVLPLHHINPDGACACSLSACDAAGKHPQPARWQLDATTDQRQIQEWWRKTPLAGVGIATGHGSGIWVLDIDERHGGHESLAELEAKHGELPNTPTVITGGGGMHYYFAQPASVDVRNRTGIAPGIDVRGSGGYVVGPGSPHKSGRTYEWEAKEVQAECPQLAPQWLMSLVIGSGGRAGPRRKVSAGRDIHENRNDALMRLGCSMRNDGFEEPGIRAALMAENDARCQPPLETWEVEKIAHSCAQYQRGTPHRAAAELEAFNRMGKWAKERPPLDGNDEVIIGRELLAEMADTDGERPVFTEGDVYRYDTTSGVWRVADERQLQRMVQQYRGKSYVGKHTKTGDPIIKQLTLSNNKVRGAVQCAQSDVHDPEFFESTEPGISVANGFLKIGPEGAHLRRHDAAHRARHSVPYNYHADARAHRWVQFLIEVFEGDECEQRAMLLQEFAGAALVAGLATEHQKCLVLHGAGANGKSVAMDVIGALIPQDLRAAVAPQRFNQDYSVATLRGVLLNAAGEIPDADVGGSDRFKSVIAGEPIQARLPYKPVFTFRPTACHMFSCNTLPGSLDHSHGYWRRFCVLSFDNTFEGDRRDEGLAARIIRTELPGVVRWAIDGAVRLMQNKGYTIPKSSTEALNEWRHSSDQVSQWVKDEAKPIRLKAVDTTTGTAARALYDNYSEWAQDTGHRRLSMMKFCQRLQRLGFVPERTSRARLYPLALRALGEQPHDWTQERASR